MEKKEIIWWSAILIGFIVYLINPLADINPWGLIIKIVAGMLMIGGCLYLTTFYSEKIDDLLKDVRLDDGKEKEGGK